MEPYTVGVGYWYSADQKKIIDQVVLTHFAAPNSYTGEDMYEISCHGGQYIKQAILESLFDQGAMPAGPGEFSRRAFINGKLDLTEAEGVMDMISAESSRQKSSSITAIEWQNFRRDKINPGKSLSNSSSNGDDHRIPGKRRYAGAKTENSSRN